MLEITCLSSTSSKMLVSKNAFACIEHNDRPPGQIWLSHDSMRTAPHRQPCSCVFNTPTKHAGGFKSSSTLRRGNSKTFDAVRENRSITGGPGGVPDVDCKQSFRLDDRGPNRTMDLDSPNTADESPPASFESIASRLKLAEILLLTLSLAPLGRSHIGHRVRYSWGVVYVGVLIQEESGFLIREFSIVTFTSSEFE